MLLEGYQMYNNIVNRYEHKHIYKILYGVGYGVHLVPIIYVSISSHNDAWEEKFAGLE